MREERINARAIALPLCLFLWVAAAGPAVAQPPDIQELLKGAMANARDVDRGAWGAHAFKRQVTRQQIDEDGDVELSQVLLFQVTPRGGGFDEQLIEIDGREPTAKEVAKHRKSGHFEKHYKQTDDVILENPFGSDLPLLPLIFDQEHRHAGEEEVDGIPCHRIRFEPRPEPSGGSVQENLKYAMKGSLCISKEGSRLVHVDVGSAREVKSGVIRIRSIRIEFEARPQGDVWLPTRFEIQSDVKVLGTTMRRHNIYRYSDYRQP